MGPTLDSVEWLIESDKESTSLQVDSILDSAFLDMDDAVKTFMALCPDADPIDVRERILGHLSEIYKMARG